MDSLLEPVTNTCQQEFCVELMKRLDIQRKNEQFCDVILEIGSDDERARVKAHKNVLCATSPFFYNALNSDMKEQKEGVIRLEETSKDVMEEVLEYLYTGHVDINERNACDLIQAGDYFLIPSLKDLSSTFILQTLCASNCVFVYYFAAKYQCENLQKGARDFIFANFETVSKSEEFLNLNVQQMEEWISSDEIIVDSEERVFEIILRWFEANERRNRQNLFYLLRHVRCVYVTREYLFNVMLPHPLVKENSDCTNLVLDTIKVAFSGTEECFFSVSPRNCLKTHEDAIVAVYGIMDLRFTPRLHQLKGICYLPSQNKWYRLNSSYPSRCVGPHQFMCAYHGKLYLMGLNHQTMRIDEDGFPYKLARRFDPTRNEWESVQCPQEVHRGSAAVTLQGFLYVIGGEDKNHYQLNTVQKYNPETNTWQEVSPLSSPRSDVCAVADERYLYVIGGGTAAEKYLNVVERFDPRSNTWDELPSILTGRQDAGGATLKQKVFVFGGLDPATTTGDPCEMFDPATSTWTGIPSVVAPRGYTRAVSFKGKVYVLGCRPNEQERQRYMALQAYDIDTNKWESCKEFCIPYDSRCTISCLRILENNLRNEIQ